MSNFYIYTIHNIINNKIYVGKTSDPEKRWRHHIDVAFSSRKREQFYVHRAILKYGINSFIFTAFHKLNNEQDCYFAEQYWIKYFNSKDPKYGYNLTDGGEGTSGRIISEVTRQKMIEKATGRKHTEKTIEKIREMSTGRKHTEEARAKMSAANIGKKLSPEHKQKLSITKIGVIFTEEHRQNMSISRKGKSLGKDNPFYGKTHTETIKESSRGANNKMAKLTEIDVINIRREYSMGECSQQYLADKYGVSRRGIGHIINYTTWAHIKDVK